MTELMTEEQIKTYEALGMMAHKPGASAEEFLVETANWQAEIEQIIKEPSFTVPKGLTREQMRDWVRKCAEGEIEADA
jgi:hypothetical protein